MLSLDMSQAFDRLPRDQLAAGFDWLNVDPHLSQLFLLWLHEATYHFQHRRVSCQVKTSQGVRQGCKASPMEWTIFLAVLLSRLDCAMPDDCLSWVQKHLLTYADDLLARWLLDSRASFHAAVHQIGIILGILEDLGMRINLSKSVILLRLSGRETKLIQKRHIHNMAGGKGLLIPRAHGPPTMLPVVIQHVYLGIKISYHNFEDQTLQYRLHIGHIAFLRLRPWLLKRHAYPLTLRIQLWQMCVRSASIHGLQATGITAQGLLRLHRRFAAQVHRIAKSPSYITHETTQDVFHRVGLPLPTQHLQETWQKQYDRLCTAWQGLTPENFLHTFDLHAHHWRTLQIFRVRDSSQFVEIQLCPYCDFTTLHQAQLTKHLTKSHMLAQDKNIFVPLRDALAGHAQCTHCGHSFASRAGLTKHIHLNQCLHFDSHRPCQAALAMHPDLRAMADSGDWSPLWSNDDLLNTLRQQCVLCGLQYPSKKGLVDHLQRIHQYAWDHAQPHMTSLAGHMAAIPCKACGHTGKRTHSCPVLRQLAIISAMHEEKLQPQDFLIVPEPGQVPLTSPLKRARQSDRRGKPPLEIFEPARDALDGQPHCAHCGVTPKTMYILRRHIEDGSCKHFDKTRPVGSHVPCTWPWLL